jgi:two-component system chemotaxis response regulator CheY
MTKSKKQATILPYAKAMFRRRNSTEFSDMSRTILAVDDSVSMRQMIAFTLKQAGYAVVEAEDGCDGLDKIRSQVPDLVLVDHNMPRMDGLTLVRSLRGMPRCANVPILMLTTESSAEIKAAGKAAGATGWIVKPFEPKRLLDVVRTVIG